MRLLDLDLRRRRGGRDGARRRQGPGAPGGRDRRPRRAARRAWRSWSTRPPTGSTSPRCAPASTPAATTWTSAGSTTSPGAAQALRRVRAARACWRCSASARRRARPTCWRRARCGSCAGSRISISVLAGGPRPRPARGRQLPLRGADAARRDHDGADGADQRPPAGDGAAAGRARAPTSATRSARPRRSSPCIPRSSRSEKLRLRT